MESKIYKGGIISLRLAGMTANSIGATTAMSAGGFVLGPAAIGFAGIVLGAQVATDYHKFKKGKMSWSDFKKSTKINSAGAGGGMLGAGTGAGTGFLIGSAIAPGIGSAIGAVIGGIAGGISG